MKEEYIIINKSQIEKRIEEAAENYSQGWGDNDDKKSFIEGAKWQAQRLYSEEEVKDLIEDWTKMANGLNINFPQDKFAKWFEQFKKK